MNGRTYAKGQLWRNERTGVTIVLVERRHPGWRVIVVFSTHPSYPVGGYDLYWDEEHDLEEADQAGQVDLLVWQANNSVEPKPQNDAPPIIQAGRFVGSQLAVCIGCWSVPEDRVDPEGSWPYHLVSRFNPKRAERCGPVLSQAQLQEWLDKLSAYENAHVAEATSKDAPSSRDFPRDFLTADSMCKDAHNSYLTDTNKTRCRTCSATFDEVWRQECFRCQPPRPVIQGSLLECSVHGLDWNRPMSNG